MKKIILAIYISILGFTGLALAISNDELRINLIKMVEKSMYESGYSESEIKKVVTTLENIEPETKLMIEKAMEKQLMTNPSDPW